MGGLLTNYILNVAGNVLDNCHRSICTSASTISRLQARTDQAKKEVARDILSVEQLRTSVHIDHEHSTGAKRGATPILLHARNDDVVGAGGSTYKCDECATENGA